MTKHFTTYENIALPLIQGSKGKGGGGGGGSEDPNSLFSTDVLFLTVGLGEGPLYRINPNGPQDIEISDGAILDLINIDGDGQENTTKFKTLTATGTTTQAPIDVFGEASVTPQNFASSVTLRKGNLNGIPAQGITLQETSAFAWDAIKFRFNIPTLQKIDDDGNILENTIKIKIQVFTNPLSGVFSNDLITERIETIKGKTNVPFNFSIKIPIPQASLNDDGYLFTITKESADSDSSKVNDIVKVVGWNEINNSKQAYPRTALIGYALKATDEHQGGVPTFTSLVKGLIIKVPSNYNQPVLEDGQIDWREVEIPRGNQVTNGYSLQKPGSGTKLTDLDPQIYVGTWDGTFVYSWTQNPVWIIYDILTNKTYGVGLSEENIDKYKFYQVAQYCDACDSITGKFIGVDALADGSFRSKPRGTFEIGGALTNKGGPVKNNQRGVAEGTKIKQRRFTMDVSLSDQNQVLDLINSLAASFRGALVYSLGKISLSVDMPDEYPVMSFTEANIKKGSVSISGNKESDMLSGVDVSYVDPTNHYKRETVRVDHDGSNQGNPKNQHENISSLDLRGVTRRSQALRYAQYQIAASKYLKRNIQFTTSTDALSLAPGDVISVAQQSSGIAYGFSGKLNADSGASNSNIFLEHFTSPSLTSSFFTANTGPIALRVLRADRDSLDLYLISNTEFKLTNSGNVSTGSDIAEINADFIFNPVTREFDSLNNFGGTRSDIAPKKGDLWALGYMEDAGDYYSSKSGRLFKVTSLTRDPDKEEIDVSGVEYISNVYVDSDTFIDYQPTAYTDIISPFQTPPVPKLDFRSVPRRRLDGSIVIDGIITNATDVEGYSQRFETEYFLSTPDFTTRVNNATQSALTLKVSNTSDLSDGAESAQLIGKNGFESRVGEIKLLCNGITTVDTAGGTLNGNVQLTLEGLNVAFDENFFTHVLNVNDPGVFSNLKGSDFATVPVKEKTAPQGLIDFVGFQTDITEISINIADFDVSNNTIKFENKETGDLKLRDVIDSVPFFVTINQLLDARFYNNSSFYVSGSTVRFEEKGDLLPISTNPVTTIELEQTPRRAEFIRFFVDGIQKSSGQFTFNKNDSVANMNANIQYNTGADDQKYRVVFDQYTVPAIEVGDNVQAFSNNTFPVINTSYTPGRASYNGALTANSIFRIELGLRPFANLSGTTFTNLGVNPEGEVNNVTQETSGLLRGNTSFTSGSCTLDYDETAFPGEFKLANSGIYKLSVGSNFEKINVDEDFAVRDLRPGITTLRARNKNFLGRFSEFVTRQIEVSDLPIQRVTNLQLTESLYREQTGGVAIRVTCSFDAIQGQEVTDYEISYRLDNIDDVGNDDGGADLTSFNTVKVAATGVDTDGKIRFTVQGINRGITSESNTVFFRVTPLNRTIRGQTATKSLSIVGKTAPPANVFDFTGGQQTDQVTLFWKYPRNANGDLADLDLKEVVVRRAPSTVAITVENFVNSDPLVTVSAGTARKSIPIDTFGTFTYLARTRDTSGNFSESVVGLTITTSRPVRSQIVQAFNEDAPSTRIDQNFGVNTNESEANFPSFSTPLYGGLVRWAEDTTSPGVNNPSTAVDNANGSSSGWSVLSASPTDLLATGPGEYITQIRDFGSIITGQIFVDIEASQSTQTLYTDTYQTIFSGVTEAATGGVTDQLKDVDFGGIAHVMGRSNTSVIVNNPRFDSNNETMMSGPVSGNVYAIWNPGQYSGNVVGITAITKANPAVLSTGSEHGIHSTAGIILSVDTIGAADASRTSGTYNGVTGTTTGSGSSHTFNITVDGTGAATVVIANGGSGHAVNDTITIADSSLGSGGAAALTFDVAQISIVDNKVIIHSVATDGMDEINNREVFLKRTGTTTLEAYTDSGLTSGLDSSGFTTYTSGGTIDQGDFANANSHALIAGFISDQEVKLANTFFANGDLATGNTFANVTVAGNSYLLVNLTQFDDFGAQDTYAGSLGAVTSQTQIRTTTAEPGDLFFANGNVDITNFDGFAIDQGFKTYQAGSQIFRQFQIKFIVNNSQPDQFDFTIDKFRYTVEKDDVIFSDTVTYAGNPTVVDFTSAGFINRPVIQIQPLSTATAQTAVVTAASATQVSFNLYDIENNLTVTSTNPPDVMVTATGV